MSIDYWRKFFRSANSGIFEIIEKAILVAASDCPDEFLTRRDRIAETIFTCRLDRCGGCARPVEESEAEERAGNEHGGGASRIASNYSYDEAEALTEEIEAAGEMVGEVMRIKEALQQDESDMLLFESLQRLQLLDLSVQTLEVTGIGKVVSGLKRHKSKQIRHLVRALIEGWTVLADEWIKATAAIAETPPDSVNKSVLSEEDALEFPPLDEGALLASQTTFEFSKIFDGIDEDGNLRNHGEFENKTERKTQLNSNPASTVCSQDKGQTGRQEIVIRRPKPQDTDNRPPRPNNDQNRQSKPTGTSLGPGRPSKLAVESKTIDDMKAPHGHSLSGVQRKPSRDVQDSDNTNAKLDIAKRRLQEGYRQAENAKKQRTIQVMELHDLPRQAQTLKKPNNIKPRNQSRNLLNGRR